MKKILAGASILLTSSVFAHDFNTDSCDVDLNGRVKMTTEALEFGDDHNNSYKIVGRDTLFVNGEEVALNGAQEDLVGEYASNVRALVPEVKTIAIEGIGLAKEGIDLAFTELLGSGNQISEDLNIELDKLSEHVNTSFSIENGIEFSEDGFVGDTYFGEDFENRLEESIENAVQKSMGTLMIAMGREMLFSGGDMEAFEARMETFGEEIEQQMEARAESIEESAHQLCMKLADVDEMENQLRDNIPEMPNVDIIRVKVSPSDKI
ncbi:DUF2884 family protein [Thalassotalea euphylliae]|uniref:DUF2884 family protein n=1 Tax=Thalassotalea euphylliae TaxID=1655234 RepID=UPI00362C179C